MVCLKIHVVVVLFMCVSSVYARAGPTGIAAGYLRKLQDELDTDTTARLSPEMKMPQGAQIMEVMREKSFKSGFTAPRRGLRIEVKFPEAAGGTFVVNSSPVRVYILQGTNLRHYVARRAAAFIVGPEGFTVPGPARVRRCIRRRYRRRCLRLRFPRRKAKCTDRIVRRCLPGFVVDVVEPSNLVEEPSPIPVANETPIPDISPESTAEASPDVEFGELEDFE